MAMPTDGKLFHSTLVIMAQASKGSKIFHLDELNRPFIIRELPKEPTT
jgi:hypothetical protein